MRKIIRGCFAIVGYKTINDAKNLDFPYMLSNELEWLPMSYQQVVEQGKMHELYFRHFIADSDGYASNAVNEALLAAYSAPTKDTMKVISPMFVNYGTFDEKISKSIKAAGLPDDFRIPSNLEKYERHNDYNDWNRLERWQAVEIEYFDDNGNPIT